MEPVEVNPASRPGDTEKDNTENILDANEPINETGDNVTLVDEPQLVDESNVDTPETTDNSETHGNVHGADSDSSDTLHIEEMDAVDLQESAYLDSNDKSINENVDEANHSENEYLEQISDEKMSNHDNEVHTLATNDSLSESYNDNGEHKHITAGQNIDDDIKTPDLKTNDALDIETNEIPDLNGDLIEQSEGTDKQYGEEHAELIIDDVDDVAEHKTDDDAGRDTITDHFQDNHVFIKNITEGDIDHNVDVTNGKFIDPLTNDTEDENDEGEVATERIVPDFSGAYGDEAYASGADNGYTQENKVFSDVAHHSADNADQQGIEANHAEIHIGEPRDGDPQDNRLHPNEQENTKAVLAANSSMADDYLEEAAATRDDDTALEIEENILHDDPLILSSAISGARGLTRQFLRRGRNFLKLIFS